MLGICEFWSSKAESNVANCCWCYHELSKLLPYHFFNGRDISLGKLSIKLLYPREKSKVFSYLRGNFFKTNAQKKKKNMIAEFLLLHLGFIQPMYVCGCSKNEKMMCYPIEIKKLMHFKDFNGILNCLIYRWII